MSAQERDRRRRAKFSQWCAWAGDPVALVQPRYRVEFEYSEMPGDALIAGVCWPGPLACGARLA